MLRKTLLPAFLILFIVSACGPLVPLSYVRGNFNNTLVQTIETKDAIVSIEFIRSQYNHYIFDLEITNLSTEGIPVAPQLINFYASPKAFPSINQATDNIHKLSARNSSLTMKRQFANNPVLTRKIYYDKAKEKAASAAFFSLLGAGLIIYDAMKDSKDCQKETWTREDQKKSIGRDLLVTAALTASDVSQLSAYQAEEDSYYIPYEMFTEYTIQPDSSIRGKIFIPIEASYRYSRVVIPFGDSEYIFDFKKRGVTRSLSQHRPSAGALRR